MTQNIIYIVESTKNDRDLQHNATTEKTVEDTTFATKKGLHIEIEDTGLLDMEENLDKNSKKTKADNSVTVQGSHF